MWFKNLRVYRLTQRINLKEEHLQACLLKNKYMPCGNHDMSRYGWVPPLGQDSEMLTHSCNGQIMICARKQEKILPPAAINELVEEKILKLQKKQSRNVARKEKLTIKDEVLHTLLPRALTRSSLIHGYFSPKHQYLIIDASSSNKAEEFLDCLRASLGVLPAVPLECHGDAAEIMTRWINKTPPKGFELDNECELQNTLDAANIIRCKNQELESEEIQMHIKSGKRAIQLGITWQNAIRFILLEDFSFKRLRFDELIIGEANTSTEDAASQFDQDFAVMSLQINQLLEQLLAGLGGIKKSD